MEHRDSSPTPEKQLLKLIEQPGTADQQKETLKRRGIALLSPSVIKGKLSFFREKTKRYLAAKKKAPLGIKGMNRALAFLTLVVAVYLAMDVAGAIGDLNQAIALDPAAWEVKDTYHTSSAGKLDYAEKIGQRKIFEFKSEEKPEEDIVGRSVKKTPEEMMLEFMKGLKFGGVGMWSGQPPEVYIEDKEGKTHTLKVGEKINQLTVEEILDNGVWLGYRGARLPLK